MTTGREESEEPRLRWSGMTDKGRFRKNNEDAFLALTFDAREVRYLGKVGESSLAEGDFIFAVSDGMGGAKSGEYASRIAVEKITEMLPKSFSIAAMGLDRGCSQALNDVVVETHEEMVRMGLFYEECRGMGATLTLCWFTPQKMYYAHVGDSRLYYLPKEGRFAQLTEDQTHVARMVRSGQLSEYEAKKRPDRNILEQVLGGNTKEVHPQLGSVIYQSGDRFALCTDGISDGISNRRVEILLTNPPARFEGKNGAERLIRDAYEESGRDNLTAVVVDVW